MRKESRKDKEILHLLWVDVLQRKRLLVLWLLDENWIEKQKKKRDRNVPIACWCFTLNNFGYEGGTARP